MTTKMTTQTTTAPRPLTEEESFGLLRNALLVAGVELGEGDHMPVVKQTIHALATDLQEYKIQKAVDAELKIHLYALLRDAEKKIPHLTHEERAEASQKLLELREIFDAYFEPAPIADELIFEDIKEMPAHIKTAAAILQTWEEENA